MAQESDSTEVETIEQSYKGNNVYSKWVISLDVPLTLPILSTQGNFFDQGLEVHLDRISALGLDFVKYSPNHKNFYSVKPQYLYRTFLFNNSPTILIEENSLAIDLTFNRQLSKTKPLYLDVSNYFVGLGISVRHTFTPSLTAFLENSNLDYSDIVNKTKMYGLISIGKIENLLNISSRSNLSKFQIDFGFPILSLANNLKSSFQSLPTEIDFLQKAAGSSIFINLRYNQLIDTKKNRYSLHYKNQIDSSWNEIIDPIKDYVPEVVKINRPRKKFYGNFRYSYDFYNNSDSILFKNGYTDIKNKGFNSFEFGYSFHFLGNHKKYHNHYVPNDFGLRYDLYVSANLKSSFFRTNVDNVESSIINFGGKFYLGGLLIFAKSDINISAGVGYFLPISSTRYSFTKQDGELKEQRSSFYLLLGKNNFSVKFESFHDKLKIFNFDDVKEDFSISFQIGI